MNGKGRKHGKATERERKHTKIFLKKHSKENAMVQQCQGIMLMLRCSVWLFRTLPSGFQGFEQLYTILPPK